MSVMAFNGSPRTTRWNTVTLLNHALEGAASKGAKTELIHLYSEMFDKEAKRRRHAEVFPEDCRRAFDLGVRVASP